MSAEAAVRSPAGPARPGPAAGGVATSIRVLRDAVGLEAERTAWEGLAERSLEPNAFYEPALLLPALEHLRPEAGVDVVLVYAQRAGEERRLCALLPVVRRSDYRGLALGVLAPWKHPHCFLCTPLLDREDAALGLAGLLEFARAEGAALLELPEVGADGPFEAALGEAAAATRCPLRVTESHERALFRPRIDAETYLRAARPRRHRRKEIERQLRRLREHGPVEFTAYAPGDDLDAWVADFLALEASGWKGRSGTAMAARPAERAFFVAAVREAAARGRLMLHSLSHAGDPIAMKCNFLAARPPDENGGAGGGGFAFKIAHDEAFSRFSPGVLLEREHLAHLHDCKEVAWLDSCAVAGHPMIDRLWLDRRRIATVLLATRPSGRWLVRTHPALRWLRRLLRAGRRAQEAS